MEEEQEISGKVCLVFNDKESENQDEDLVDKNEIPSTQLSSSFIKLLLWVK